MLTHRRGCRVKECNAASVPDSAELKKRLKIFGRFAINICLRCGSAFCHPAPGDNVIMKELKKKHVKILSEKVLLLLNRGGKNTFSVILP